MWNRQRLWGILVVLLTARWAWASSVGAGEPAVAPISGLIIFLTGILFLIGGLIVIAIFAFGIGRFLGGREHMWEGVSMIFCSLIAGVTLWQVAPSFRDGIQAEAATPERISPQAIVEQFTPQALLEEWDGDHF